jgi:HK97 family phage portal protein
MGMFGNIYARIKGGWRTVGAPGSQFFGMSERHDQQLDIVGSSMAMKLSAYYACVRLLSETMGSLSFKLYDQDNNLVKSHDLYGLLQDPNQYQTGDSFVAAMTANKTVYGNGMAHIKRLGGKPYALDFYESEMWGVSSDAQGRPKFSINGEDVPYEDVLHWPGMSLGGYWGVPTLASAAHVLAMQTAGNDASQRTFANGLRAGGFFELPENKQAFTSAQLEVFNGNLREMAQPQNTAKWMPLLPGMKPVANANFRIDPVTAELLQSRYFGIEEICRFMGVPPPLVGHTDKASSWASSLGNLNQFLVTYTVLPQAIRLENEMRRKLLGRNHAQQLRPTFNMDSLLRGDIAARFATYQIGIEQGIYNPNEVRGYENMPVRSGGDKFTSAAPKTTPAAPAAPAAKEQ